MDKEFKNKTILVTGGTGSIGSVLVRELLASGPRQVRVFSRDDTKQYHLRESLGYPKNLRLLIGDIRDRERLLLAFDGVDIVLHAAALKHVPIGEYNPFELVKTNIIGSQNVIDAALEKRIKKVVAISTDKVVHPANAMGVTKLMMEKLFINANYYKGEAPTKFSCVRFGNVAWARGSVLELWKQQAARDGAIAVMNANMSRFFMSSAQAIRLVLRATALTQGGEVFVFKMPSIKLLDLAAIFLKKYFPDKKVRVNIVGNRGGEKLHEELFDGQDQHKQLLEDKELFVIVPNVEIFELKPSRIYYAGFRKVAQPQQYSSLDRIDRAAVVRLV